MGGEPFVLGVADQASPAVSLTQSEKSGNYVGSLSPNRRSFTDAEAKFQCVCEGCRMIDKNDNSLKRRIR